MGSQPEKKKISESVDHRFSLREVINIFSLFGFLYGQLDDRLELREALDAQLKAPVGKHINLSFCFGGLTFMFVIINVITGVFLMIYYRPTTAEAYNSVMMVTNQIPFGWLMRGMHHWSANLMMITILLHMLRVFVYGAYKNPREFNWVVGVTLFLIVLAFGFTGYLLPWNQVSYWATTVGTEAPSAMPLLGRTVVSLLRGGEMVTGLTLTRFYAVHVAILPIVIGGLLILHFLMIRRQGIVGPL